MNNLSECLYRYSHLREVPGKDSNPELLAIIRKYLPATKDDSEVSWCSIILMYALGNAGYDIKNATVAARSWLKVGEEVKKPVEKDTIVVFWRERINSWKGHVGIYMGKGSQPGYIKVLGGNQNDRVNVAEYPISRILGYRKLNKLDKDMKNEQIKEIVSNLNEKLEATLQAAKKIENKTISKFLDRST